MEYIIIILLVILLIISVISLMKNINEAHITERIGKLETNVVKELGDFKNDFSRDLNSDFIALNESLENKLNLINYRVNERLD